MLTRASGNAFGALLISDCNIQRDWLEKALKQLKPKKAEDQIKWKNEYIQIGGEAMKEGLITLFNMMYNQQMTPDVWEYIRIKSIPKDQSYRINKRRGLFITKSDNCCRHASW